MSSPSAVGGLTTTTVVAWQRALPPRHPLSSASQRVLLDRARVFARVTGAAEAAALEQLGQREVFILRLATRLVGAVNDDLTRRRQAGLATTKAAAKTIVEETVKAAERRAIGDGADGAEAFFAALRPVVADTVARLSEESRVLDPVSQVRYGRLLDEVTATFVAEFAKSEDQRRATELARRSLQQSFYRLDALEGRTVDDDDAEACRAEALRHGRAGVAVTRLDGPASRERAAAALAAHGNTSVEVGSTRTKESLLWWAAQRVRRQGLSNEDLEGAIGAEAARLSSRANLTDDRLLQQLATVEAQVGRAADADAERYRKIAGYQLGVHGWSATEGNIDDALVAFEELVRERLVWREVSGRGPLSKQELLNLCSWAVIDWTRGSSRRSPVDDDADEPDEIDDIPDADADEELSQLFGRMSLTEILAGLSRVTMKTLTTARPGSSRDYWIRVTTTAYHLFHDVARDGVAADRPLTTLVRKVLEDLRVPVDDKNFNQTVTRVTKGVRSLLSQARASASP